MKRLLIVTDAWEPQTNGVVTTLTSVIPHLPALGYEVRVIHPGLFTTRPLPGYREIGVACDPWRLARLMDQAPPDTVHIATEGPLGIAARSLLARRGWPFSTSLHTKFPEYARERIGAPLSLGYAYLRWFHRPASAVLCTTESHREELARWGIANLVVWGRGVDTARFRPLPRAPRARPRLLYVGRVAVEKNLEAFLSLPLDADKVVVGDGPARADLERRFPDALWLGYRHGDALVAEYAEADVFVFPSRTDTFGLVMLEAMACGTPVAGHPVTGPVDVIETGINGVLDEDLARAVRDALGIDRGACRSWTMRQDWRRVAERMVSAFVHVDRSPPLDSGPLQAAAAHTSRRSGRRGSGEAGSKAA
jgi:glycosyltransferase involved in cell wall biosynthesis